VVARVDEECERIYASGSKLYAHVEMVLFLFGSVNGHVRMGCVLLALMELNGVEKSRWRGEAMTESQYPSIIQHLNWLAVACG
jgi:hypothetical protein